jgi:tetratricopeptide (TPR) repeat protein
MTSCEQSAETILAIILGAQEWPKCHGLTSMPQAFTAANGFVNYLNSALGLNLPKENILNLFDSVITASAMLMDAKNFLSQRQDEILKELGRPATDLFVYFAGHGDPFLQNKTYILFVRSTDPTQPATTGLLPVNLAELIRTAANNLRCYVILDACYSGAALEGFLNQPLNKKGEEAATPAFPSRGVSLFCSSSGGAPSKAFQKNAYPMFTGELLEALNRGDPKGGGRLSVREIENLTISGLREKHNDSMVWPIIHSPIQFPGGEVASFPLFPNPAVQEVSSPDISSWEIENKKQEIFEDNPYLLGATFAGREECLRDITAWAEDDEARILCICDLGGTGKTSLVWNWFTREATQQALAEQGYSKFWATFYAKGYDWLKFLRHLAFSLNLQLMELGSSAGLNTVEGQRSLQKAILRRLQDERWFIVLDGLEREMGAFADPGNQHDDSEKQDLRNENAEIPFEERFIRSLVFGEFIRALRDSQAKVIVTSRLFPEDLRGDYRDRRVIEYPFRPMSPDDALRVWNSVPDASDCLVDHEDVDFQRSFFTAIGYHPQVIVIVASAVVESAELPGFRNWFNQFIDEQAACLDGSEKTILRHRWIELATRDIVSDKEKKKGWIVLCRIAAQPDASDVETLVTSLVGSAPRLFPSRGKLTEALRYLQKRRLLGYDENRGQVDVHPVIRTQITKYILAQVEKNRAGGDADQEVLQHLADFGSAGEIYQKFLSQPQLEEALQAIDNIDPLISSFGYKYFLRAILGKVFPRCGMRGSPWLETLPALRQRKEQALWLRRTGSALMASGNWEESIVLFRRAQLAYRLCGDTESVEECARSLDWQRIYGGSLHASEIRLLDSLEKSGHANFPNSDCYRLALILAIRGAPSARRALEILPSDTDRWTMQTVAEAWYYLEEYDKAKELAAASLERKERTVTGQWLWELVTLGLARLRLGEVDEAGENLHVAAEEGHGHYYPIITMFAYAGYIEHLYLAGIAAAAKMHLFKHEKLAEALRIYSRYTQCDSKNQYQISAAEAHLAAAKVELELGNEGKAIQLAEVALQVARGSNPPFIYSAGQNRALAFLDSLGQPAPMLPPVDLLAVDAHEDRVRRLIKKWEGRNNVNQ